MFNPFDAEELWMDHLIIKKKKTKKNVPFSFLFEKVVYGLGRKCMGSFWLLDSQLFSAVYRTHVSIKEPELNMNFWIDCSKGVLVKSNGYYYKW